MAGDMDQFRQTYITECYELLQEMEGLLLGLDPEAPDLEDVNAIFRCAHSIKGGAGAFGFTNITHFTHILETLLDAMREERTPITREGVDALLKSVDIVTQMVQGAENATALPENYGAEVAAELSAIVDDPSLAPMPAAASAGVPSAGEEAAATVACWHIAFKPHKELMAHGNEPMLIIRELMSLGELQTVADGTQVPPLDAIEPEDCYLSWQFELTTDKPEADIREVFEFVEDDCDLTILRPDGPVADEAEVADGAPLAVTPDAAEAVQATKPEAGAGMEAAAVSQPPVKVATSIRVDVDKVDRLVNMVGELVITQAFLQAQTRNIPLDRYPDLIRGIEELTQHSRELQEAVMAVRMQPVKSIFSRMPRIVRDLSAQLGKKIRMETVGENTEVDKTVVEQLGDPLTHMIRNSVDHGIESPQVRRENGKPEEGTIRLTADNRGGRIVLEIEDDGAGINRERVRAKAIDKGVISAEANLSDEEIDNLIFAPGFSTAEEVSNISGRGVGMDVVRRNIEALGGVVHLRSKPGQGSVITISLPLTLAILDGMIVGVGKEYYIIPIANILETMRPRPEEVRKIADGNDVINVRGEFIPILYLCRCFDIPGAETDPSKALVVLAEHGREKVGLVVDELVGQQQVVIKSLESNADPIVGVSGATILGDGKVSLIIDVAGLQKVSGTGQHLGIKEAA